MCIYRFDRSIEGNKNQLKSILNFLSPAAIPRLPMAFTLAGAGAGAGDKIMAVAGAGAGAGARVMAGAGAGAGVTQKRPGIGRGRGRGRGPGRSIAHAERSCQGCSSFPVCSWLGTRT